MRQDIRSESFNDYPSNRYDVCVDILRAIADLSSILLIDENLDRSVNEALKILGPSIAADRLNLLKHCDDPTGKTLGCVAAKYEWTSDGTKSQIASSRLNHVSYQGIEDCYHLMLEGKHWGGSIDTLPEPFKSEQLQLGVMATYAIPIEVNKKYWGIIGLDFCKLARKLEASEIEVLKTAATCIGSAIEKERIVREREKIVKEASLAKREAEILTKKDRILALTTNVAQILLNDENLETSISKALRIVGEGINTDRVVVMEHHDDSIDASLGYLQMLYEWHSSATVSQLHHSNLNQISYEGIENWYEELNQGNVMGGIVENLSEPVRSGQKKLGVLSTYAIPIAIDSKYWGIVGFDDCREAKQRSPEEISILKTTAICIGSAIAKNRVRQQREQAERNILLEQQKAAQLVNQNQILEQRDRLLEVTASAAQVISTESNFDLAIDRALQIIGEGIATDRVLVAEYFGNSTDISRLNWKIIYEWDSADAISQIDRPEAARGNHEGIEAWYRILNSGKSISYELAQMPEPFRSKQAQVGVKMLHAVPVIVDEKQWGVLVINDCRTEIFRSRAELNILKTAAACIGGAIERERDRCAREAAEKTILLEREQAALIKANRLKEYNQILEQRDLLLRATAEVSNVLSTENNFDEAVNRALQIIGETLNTDRVTVLENWRNSAKPEIPHWRLLYEWHSARTISQISHPELTQGSYEGIEKWYELQKQGHNIRCGIEEMPEPFRDGQEKLGVKVIYGVPIFTKGKHWGIVGIDDCHQKTNRSEAELSIIKTIAACLGGAIEKERIRSAKEEAEKAILLEREKAALEKTVSLLKSNQILSLRDRWLEATANAANKLLKNADLEAGINAALKVLGESLDCDRVIIVKHYDNGKEFVQILYEWDSLHAISQISHPELNEVSSEGIEDWFVTLKAGGWIGGAINEFREPFRSGQIELGVKATYSVPIFVNNIYWGAICIDFCREPRCLNEPEIAVFKTAASCIGSAIYRQQIQQDKESAELAILDERNRMAREIHDTLAQAFTGISLQLEAARNILATQPEVARTRLLQAKTLAKEGIVEARRSVRALRPETLEFNNLAIALQQLVNNMTDGINIKTSIIIQGEPQLAADLEADLYRIAQEAITNTLRHAQATELSLSLLSQTDLVELKIEDNGIGFQLDRGIEGCFGLIGMQERCDLHNGTLSIDSARGTTIAITVFI